MHRVFFLCDFLLNGCDNMMNINWLLKKNTANLYEMKKLINDEETISTSYNLATKIYNIR